MINLHDLAGLISALNIAGLIGSISAAIAAVGANRASKAAQTSSAKAEKAAQTSAAELSPNHGSSLKDSVTRIEQQQKHQSEMIKSLGHQMGEIHSSSNTTHAAFADQLDDHARRLRNIENRKPPEK